MNRLLLLELRKIIPVFLLIYVGGIFEIYYGHNWAFIIVAPAVSVVLANQLLRRSSWYLSLPWSRRRLMLAILYQCLAVFFSTALLSTIILYSAGIFDFKEEFEAMIIFTSISWLVGLFFGLIRILYAMPPKQRFGLSRKDYWKIGIVVFVFFLIWYFDILKEPVFYALTWIVLFFGGIGAFCYDLVLPERDQGRIVLISKTLGTFIIILLIGGAIASANFDKANYYRIDDALIFLGRVPAFISDARAESLFVDSQIGSNPTMLKHLDFLKANTSSESWEKRTKECRARDCLDLSADVAGPDQIGPEKAAQRFLVLMNKCAPKLDNFDRVTCSGRRMCDVHLATWINYLKNNGVLDKWLSDPNPDQQIFALKGLAYSFNEDQEKKIKQLKNSADGRVATIANLVLASRDKFVALKLDCASPKDKGKDDCLNRTSDDRIFRYFL